MERAYDVIAAGHICLDISPVIESTSHTSIAQFLSPGRLINLDGVTFSAGGPVANTGFALSKLGLSVLPMANIGADEFGVILKNVIKKEIGIDFKLDQKTRTSYSIILSIPGIDRIILHDPAGNNYFGVKAINFNLLGEAKIFHFGYPPLMRAVYQNSGEELIEIYKRAKTTGVTTSLDMSLPDTDSESGRVNWQVIMEETLPYVDVFLPSVEEALYIFDRKEYLRVKTIADNDDFVNHINMNKVCEIGERILQNGVAIAVIKCGSKGIYIKTASSERISNMGASHPRKTEAWCNKELFEETYHVSNFKSALAGGDTTIAGLLTGLVKGYDIYKSLKIACMTGALCCTTYDSISGLLPLDQIVKKIDQNNKKNKFDKLKDMFVYDPNEEVWCHK